MPDQSAICREVRRCRVCGGSSLHPVIDLGEQYIAGIFASGPIPESVNERFPLQLVRCSDEGGCGLVQLKHSIAPEVLYSAYGYRSGTNETMRANLREIARSAEEMSGLSSGDVVLDIGCNDGTLLLGYEMKGLVKIGIDPSDAVQDISAEEITVVPEFFSAEAFQRATPRKAKVVTSIAMFYDLEDPNAFVADVASVLEDDGLWIIELSYLPSMLAVNSFDTICHEHLEYYALEQIDWLADAHSLRVVKVEFNEINGGSFRVFLRHDNGKEEIEDPALTRARERERSLSLRRDEPFASFRAAAAKVRDDLTSLVARLKEEGRTIYTYGASTKGNTILQFCDLDHRHIGKAADRNPDKWGTSTLGSNIPIVSEEEARKDRPDYFLVLPWHFVDGFIERESEYLSSGGRFIVPLPTVRVIGVGGAPV